MNYVPTRKQLIDKEVQCLQCQDYCGVCGDGLEDDKYIVFYCPKSILLYKRWQVITFSCFPIIQRVASGNILLFSTIIWSI